MEQLLVKQQSQLTGSANKVFSNFTAITWTLDGSKYLYINTGQEFRILSQGDSCPTSNPSNCKSSSGQSQVLKNPENLYFKNSKKPNQTPKVFLKEHIKHHPRPSFFKAEDCLKATSDGTPSDLLTSQELCHYLQFTPWLLVFSAPCSSPSSCKDYEFV